jgi:hypothetical protein
MLPRPEFHLTPIIFSPVASESDDLYVKPAKKMKASEVADFFDKVPTTGASKKPVARKISKSMKRKTPEKKAPAKIVIDSDEDMQDVRPPPKRTVRGGAKKNYVELLSDDDDVDEGEQSAFMDDE